jgi:FlaA1/EpsC-like NDP-sugar epimerase
MKHFYRNKVILITGAAGTVGSELIRQLVAFDPAELRLLDNNETALFHAGNEYVHTGKVTPYLGDIRDKQKILNVTQGVDIIFHTAAFKHVCFSEYNPFDAVQTNVNGVKNVVQAALFNKVPRVIFTSSDKAVNPTNVMGTTKLMGERIVTAANIVNNNGYQVFSSVRFGNVLGSRGSVIHIFADQILRGEAVTVTDPQMTRFVMTIREAARLVLEAAMRACGGEVLVTKMPVLRILDLAQAMINLLAPQAGFNPEQIPIRYVGAKPGEKLYEELMSLEEVNRTKELLTMFAILPAFRSFYQKIDYQYPVILSETKNLQPYISSNQLCMPVQEIMTYLERHGILEEYLSEKLYRSPARHISDASSKPDLTLLKVSSL